MFRVDTPTAIAVMPPLKSAGTPGYFTEGGAGQSPTVPGADWFNMMQEEVMGVLLAAELVPDKTKMNQLSLAINTLIDAQFSQVKEPQFLPYDAARVYRTGETCTTIVGGELKIWEMYAGPNLTCTNKDPNDPANRHDGWLLDTAPFWWIEYGNMPGRPSYWLAETAPERAVMEMGQDLPTAVYWRLARQYPLLVNTPAGTINTGEIRGEFLRVWDGGRGVDAGRAINSWQKGSLAVTDTGGGGVWSVRVSANTTETAARSVIGLDSYDVSKYSGGSLVSAQNSATFALPGGGGDLGTTGITRPRNVARTMIIEI